MHAPTSGARLLDIIRFQVLALSRQKTLLGLSVGLLLALATLDVGSVPISPDDFGPNKVVETFDSIAGLTGQPATPFVVNDLTFETESGTVRVFTPASGGDIECLGGAGSCLGTGTFDLESMDILLASPVTRAGLWVGLWTATGAYITSADVFFYDQSDNLLGTVSVEGLRMNFAGWEANSASIARIRVTDTAANGRVIAVDDVTTSVVTTETVLIDIKPGSDPASINPKTNGKIHVAILTTDIFDATTVNASTVHFGAAGTEAAPVQVAVEDVNGDGRPDLLLTFNIQATGITCGATSASLTGETQSRQAIKGTDAIQTVGCK
jgi:hypothetical protein